MSIRNTLENPGKIIPSFHLLARGKKETLGLNIPLPFPMGPCFTLFGPLFSRALFLEEGGAFHFGRAARLIEAAADEEVHNVGVETASADMVLEDLQGLLDG